MRAHPKGSYEGIGVSLPGRIDARTHRLIFAPSLAWGEVDIKTPLEKITGLEVELENAANACALAELWSGRHGETVRNLAAVTVSEGIGVGMIINGQLVQGSTGVAGEFGHVALFENRLPCRCGNHGCWETMASNLAAIRFYHESTLQRKGEVGAKSDMAQMTYTDLLRLAEQGDAKALKALTHAAHHLGIGMAMLISGLAPDVLVVVGEITRLWDKLGGVVEAAVKERAVTHAATRILPTNPDVQPRLKGTIALVLQKHFGAPFIA
jgi:predicted NBD/HSP70 family sugar kinase